MINILNFILTQINLEGFEEAAEHSTLFAILVSIIVILFAVVLFLFKEFKDANNKIIVNQESYATKIDEIRKENEKKESLRATEWMDSEKETLIVLKGVNSVLEMSEKMKENDTNKIIDKISSIENVIKELKK